MRRTIAAPLWDLSVVVTCLLPLPFVVALKNDRNEAAVWYAAIWALVVLVTLITARVRRYSLRAYLADLKPR
ncbi:MAG: hypothetical protein ACRDJI_07455 [Actinomycetota bacterium]